MKNEWYLTFVFTTLLRVKNAHNEYLKIAIDLSIINHLYYLVLLIWILDKLTKKYIQLKLVKYLLSSRIN